MKVKVLRKFKDAHSGKIHKVGDTLTINKERMAELEAAGKKHNTQFVEEVKEEKDAAK